jgi:hypothetical protein
MLAHDLANKLAAIVANCDMLQMEILRTEIQLGSKTYDRIAKVMELAYEMGDMLLTRECELGNPVSSLAAQAHPSHTDAR